MLALDMQRMIGREQRRTGQLIPNTAAGYRLCARWWYWDSRLSAAPASALAAAKNMYRASRAQARA